MADVFISYASNDRETAGKLAKLLEGLDYSIFWDREILPGTNWDEVIEAELERAKVVVVLWSSDSIKSRWVKAEAEEGAARNILVPAMIATVKIPLAFRQIQTVDLTHSKYTKGDSNLTNLLSAIRGKMGIVSESEHESVHRLETLIKSLNDSSDSVRVSAAKSLERMGGEAAQALPALIKALSSKDIDFLDAVVDAIDAIDPEQGRPALKKLKTRLEQQRPGDLIDGSEPEDALIGKLTILGVDFE